MSKPIKKAIHTVQHGLKLDSKYEAKILSILKPFNYQGVGIEPQFKVQVRPANQIFKARYWKCDFLLKSGEKRLLVEAKGYIDPTFIFTLEMLASHYPIEFNRLIIVIPNYHKPPNKWEPFINQVVTENELSKRVTEWLAT